MAKLYKLTNTDKTTKNGMKWGYRVTNEVSVVDNPKLCSSDVIHAYESLEVAAFMRFNHGYGDDVKCFEAEGDIVVSDNTKCGVFKLKTGKMVDLPTPTIKQSVLFALLCTKEVFNHKNIDAAIEAAKAGDYRAAAVAAYTAYTAAAAAYAAASAAAYAADAAAAYAADAAYAAARAASAAASAAAYTAAAAYAADAAAYAAYAAAWAAAAWAADATAYADINLKQIALKALNYA